jgi:hypothetical protein
VDSNYKEVGCGHESDGLPARSSCSSASRPSVFFLRIFLRVGFPQLQDGAKGVVYAWVLTISIPLPLTTGVALLWGIRSWRPFVGWWFLVAAVLALGSLVWFLPSYQGWPFTLVVGSAVCVFPPILCSLFLLLWKKR